MKNFRKYNLCTYFLSALMAIISVGCSDDEDVRPYQDATLVGVKIDKNLYLPDVEGTEATVILPAGKNLDKLNLQLLVANGKLEKFENNAYYDCKKPLDFAIEAYNGGLVDYKLRIQSPPKLAGLYIEGLTISEEFIFMSLDKIIVQVPVGTDLSAQKVTLSFVNGTVSGFENGVELDYTKPVEFTITGLDDETIYPYELILTTETVGPASIKGITVNGVLSDSVVMVDNKLIPYIQGLTDFTNANIELICGFGNTVAADAVLTGLNLFTAENKVKVTGTNGVETEFTIGSPKLSLTPTLEKEYASFNFGSDALTSFAFAKDHFVVANHNTKDAATTPIGPSYYKLNGEYGGALSKEGALIDGGIVLGIRKLAGDSKGVILGVPLGATAPATKEMTIWRWDDVTANPTAYITYTATSAGVSSARAAGISIQGSLDGDAIITVPIAQKKEVLVWTVTGGVLTPQPTKMDFPHQLGYYYTVSAMPIGKDGYVGFALGNTIMGIVSLNSTMSELFTAKGFPVTDGAVVEHNGRVYLGFTVHGNGKGAYHRICDITDGQLKSYQNPIMDILMPSKAANGNGTVDASFMVIDGKLHAGFTDTNVGLRIYALEK